MIKVDSPAPLEDKAKKFVPKKLEMKVAGRKNIVNVAMLFIADESLRMVVLS